MAAAVCISCSKEGSTGWSQVFWHIHHVGQAVPDVSETMLPLLPGSGSPKSYSNVHSLLFSWTVVPSKMNESHSVKMQGTNEPLMHHHIPKDNLVTGFRGLNFSLSVCVCVLCAYLYALLGFAIGSSVTYCSNNLKYFCTCFSKTTLPDWEPGYFSH
jgi:hypothetical protein